MDEFEEHFQHLPEERGEFATLPEATDMMDNLRSFQAQVVPLESGSDLSFDEFVQVAIQHAREGFSQVTEPDGDLAPFLVVAERRGLALVLFERLDPDLLESNLPLVVGSALAAYDVSIVGLLLTGFLTERSSAGEPVRRESLLLGLLQLVDGIEHGATYAAAIERSPEEPPRLSEFELIDDQLPPALHEALHQGLTAELEHP